MLAEIEKLYDNGKLDGLHGVLVVRDGDVLAECYRPGPDQRWGTSIGVQNHGEHSLHDLRSITKSVVSLLYGMALDDERVPLPSAGLIKQFPQCKDLLADPQKQKIVVGHALSMKMGMRWNEMLPYSDPENSEIAMENAADRYRYVLEQPMDNEPGDWWNYSGGASALIADIIARGMGMPIDQFAHERLFAPLGITNYEWVHGPDGTASAASGLRLTLRDLVKIGDLVLNRGSFAGKTIVSEAWLDESFLPRTRLDAQRYGYFWWLSSQGASPDWVAGSGNGGQKLWMHPDSATIVAVFAGNYNEPDAWQCSERIISTCVPSIATRDTS